MTAWALQCWARDISDGEVLSWHPTLDAAIDAALAWIVADREVVPSLRGVYTICEVDPYTPR